MDTKYIIHLPKEEWHRCPSCGGSGQTFQDRDCHRSAGWIPCGRCYHGVVREKIVSCGRRRKADAMTRQKQVTDFIQTIRDQIKVADRFSEDKALTPSVRGHWLRISTALRSILAMMGNW